MSAAVIELLVSSALRTGALVIVVLVVIRLCGGRSSNMVHRVWTLAVACGLAMPALVVWSPKAAFLTAETFGAARERSPTPAVRRPSVSAERAVRSDARDLDPSVVSVSLHSPGLARNRPWEEWATAIYLLLAGGLGLHTLRGWFGMRRVVGRSLPTRIGNVAVRVSSDISVPVTAGILCPTILLPSDWGAWSGARRDAVLEHERAHIDGHDTLWAFLSRLHCCLFWFSPFSWWIDRKWAEAAEHAADDRAIVRLGSSREYLRTLVEFAGRKRLAHSMVGVGGRGRTDRRVERILRREAWTCRSRARRFAATALTLVAAAGLAACGLGEPPFEEVRRERSRHIADRNQEWIDAISSPSPGAPMELYGTPDWDAYLRERRERLDEQRRLIADLEAILDEEPENLDARTRLLVYHATPVLGSEHSTQLRSERESHALWLIEHDPGHELLSLAGRLVSDAMHLGESGSASPEAMQSADRLWRLHAENPNASPEVLDNAAYFFEHFDLPFAVDLLERAEAIDPDPARSFRKGVLYGLVLSSRTVIPNALGRGIGPVIADPYHVPRPTIGGAPGNVDRVYATHVREELEGTRNVRLLEAVAQMMLDPVVRETFDPASSGWRYVERALEIDPDSLIANQLMVDRYRALRGLAVERIIKGAWPERTPLEAVREAGPEWEFLYLLDMAADPSEFAPASAQRSRARVRAFQGDSVVLAENLLAVAPEFRDNPNYGAAIYFANILLGLDAEDDADAARHLLAAIEIPDSEEVRYRPGTFWQLLCVRLAESGDSGAVAEFRERFERKTVGQAFAFRTIDEFLAGSE